jgi:hypothetical protein
VRSPHDWNVDRLDTWAASRASTTTTSGLCRLQQVLVDAMEPGSSFPWDKTESARRARASVAQAFKAYKALERERMIRRDWLGEISSSFRPDAVAKAASCLLGTISVKDTVVPEGIPERIQARVRRALA